MNRTNMNTSDMDTSKDTSGLMIAGNMIRVTDYLGPTYIRICPECKAAAVENLDEAFFTCHNCGHKYNKKRS